VGFAAVGVGVALIGLEERVVGLVGVAVVVVLLLDLYYHYPIDNA
jgi:hypothetical protein